MNFIFKRLSGLFLIVGVIATLSPAVLAQPNPNAGEAAPTDQGWPRKFNSGANSFSVYQPEIEQWQGNRIEARAAVAVAEEQSKQTAYGVIWFAARTEIDKINRLVTMTDIRVTRVSFPTAGDKANLYQSLLQQQVPKAGQVIALDRLLADLSMAQADDENSGYQLKNDPPRILFSTRPAILILMDGAPVLRPIKDTRLERVINTRALIVRDDSNGRFYMHLMDGWVESPAATGPWMVAETTSPDLNIALRMASDSKQVDLLDGSTARSTNKPSLKTSGPIVYTSTEPAELIQTQGDPQVAPIEGTQLVYVVNTENDIFIDASTQNHYVLISGRWFGSQSMNGPWVYVPGRELPADFAKISPTHPKADVLVSIPGTPQAKEALIANKIPQTTTVSRNGATLTINYDGEPQFRPIAGTPLQYAINTATPVIAVSANAYYAVESGVWFVAHSARGVWVAATEVPAIIYTIPPSSPLHYVTYVKVYGSTPESVYLGYTPGYSGTVVSSDHVVVYGTGWYVPPYNGSYWYGYGWTYGYAAGFAWSTYAGWSVAYGIGYAWCPYYHPAAYGYYGAAAATNVYGQWGNVAYSGTRAAWANPYTGNVGQVAGFSGVNTVTGATYNGRAFTNTNVYTGTTVSGIGGTSYNPNTGRTTAGQAGAVSNAYTGNAAVGGRGASYNPSTGVISAGAGGAAYNASTGQVTAGGAGFRYNTNTNTGVAVGNNNVYAGKDGSVYRYNKEDGLQQHTGSGWSSVSRPADTKNIQNQQAARATGQQRWDNFRTGGATNTGGSRPSGRFTGAGPQSGNGPRFGGRRH
jgi:hypothetical protein